MTVPASARATYVGLGTGISTGRGSDYAALSRLIRQDGLLNRRPGYYATKICIMAVLYIAGWAAVAALGASWYQLLAAVYLAAVFGQLAFVGHEAGHRQIFRSRRGNDVAGLLLGNLLIGLSFGWWTGKHNRHHAHPNQLGKDPDLDIPAKIEHHLFPSMPRPSLRRCRSLVRAFCAQHELPYSELNLVASYAQVLRALHAAGS